MLALTWIHLVARSYAGLRPFASFERCSWTWQRLRERFPRARSCTLMPNGLHLVLASDGVAAADAARYHHELIHLLRGFTRRHGQGRRLFEPVPTPAIITDRLHRWRTERYVPLNPCRAGYASDPLEWLWSTYRDVMGAAVDPWITADEVACAHQRPREGFEADFHAYVSADPSVAVGGTAPPLPAASTRVAQFPLRRIQLAVAAACRIPCQAVLSTCQPRRLFVALARDQGWPHRVIAETAGMTMQGLRRVTVEPQALAAARLCLGDDRLLVAVDDGGTSRTKRPKREPFSAPTPLARQKVLHTNGFPR